MQGKDRAEQVRQRGQKGPFCRGRARRVGSSDSKDKTNQARCYGSQAGPGPPQGQRGLEQRFSEALESCSPHEGSGTAALRELPV